MRPVSATMRVLTNGGQDIVFAPYGDYWRQLRKIAVVELFTVHRVRSFHAVREEELRKIAVVELFTARRVRSFRAVREEEVAAALRGVGESAATARPVEMRGLAASRARGGQHGAAPASPAAAGCALTAGTPAAAGSAPTAASGGGLPERDSGGIPSGSSAADGPGGVPAPEPTAASPGRHSASARVVAGPLSLAGQET
ncbi:putative cytochrome P450 [Hordeum vulgare]|nr:putative cytochrome P450 [Hordeum vulgare]